MHRGGPSWGDGDADEPQTSKGGLLTYEREPRLPALVFWSCCRTTSRRDWWLEACAGRGRAWTGAWMVGACFSPLTHN